MTTDSVKLWPFLALAYGHSGFHDGAVLEVIPENPCVLWCQSSCRWVLWRMETRRSWDLAPQIWIEWKPCSVCVCVFACRQHRATWKDVLSRDKDVWPQRYRVSEQFQIHWQCKSTHHFSPTCVGSLYLEVVKVEYVLRMCGMEWCIFKWLTPHIVKLYVSYSQTFPHLFSPPGGKLLSMSNQIFTCFRVMVLYFVVIWMLKCRYCKVNCQSPQSNHTYDRLNSRMSESWSLAWG